MHRAKIISMPGENVPKVIVKKTPFVKGRKLNLRQKRQVKRIVMHGRELKYFETLVNRTAVSNAAGVLVSLTDVPAGTTDITRLADRLQLTSSMLVHLQLRGAEFSVTPSDAYNTMRCIIFQFKDVTTAGTSPSAAAILLNGPTGAIDCWSGYNWDNRPNYTILWDKVFTMVNNVDTATTSNYQNNHVYNLQFKLSLKKARKDIQYIAATTEGTNGKIFFLIISDSAATVHPSFMLNTRITYRDA